jgi:hypothetical protein
MELYLAFAGAVLAAFQIFEWSGALLVPLFGPALLLAKKRTERISGDRLRRLSSAIVWISLVILVVILMLIPLAISVIGLVLTYLNNRLNKYWQDWAIQNQFLFTASMSHPRMRLILRGYLGRDPRRTQRAMNNRREWQAAISRTQVPFLGWVGFMLVVAAFIIGQIT